MVFEAVYTDRRDCGEMQCTRSITLSPLVFDYFPFKGGYLDFSHLSELKKIHITEIYMKKTIQIINKKESLS